MSTENSQNQTALDLLREGFCIENKCLERGTDRYRFARSFELTDGFLSGTNSCAIVVVNERTHGKSMKQVRGAVFAVEDEETPDGYKKPDVLHPAAVLKFMRDSKVPGKCGNLLLFPRPYLEEQGLIDEVDQILRFKLQHGQKTLTPRETGALYFFDLKKQRKLAPNTSRDSKMEQSLAEEGKQLDKRLGEYLVDVSKPAPEDKGYKFNLGEP